MSKSFYITLALLVVTALGAVIIPSYAHQKLPTQYKSDSLCDTVLLEFYWEKCSACRNIAPFVDQVETNLKSKGLKVKRINIYEGDNMKMAKAFKVNAVPAFFLFGGNQKTIETLPIGSVSGANLENKIDTAISKYRASKKCS
ncbi:MAG: thioredoxin family protein [Vampirovibrionales bacterium]|jgi:thiol-disulfide isomerase/thioredoxin